ncbi:MAG: flagellar hook-basal body protein [Oligoflexia bacterium]
MQAGWAHFSRQLANSADRNLSCGQKLSRFQESSKVSGSARRLPSFDHEKGDNLVASGIWNATAGAVAQSQVVDTVANNLANVDTLGFKKDSVTFREFLAIEEREPTGADIPRGPVKDKDFYPLDGKDQAFVVVDGTYSNFRPGPLKVTHATLDVAIDGPGFFEVSTPSGIRYTRQGSFKLATDGRLVTSDGFPVLASQPGGLAAENPNTAQPVANAQLGQGGLETQGGVSTDAGIAARFINLKDAAGKVSFSPSGEIYSGGELVAKLSVREFQDPRKLRKVGGALFESREPANLKNAERSELRQGLLEGSNVNPVEEMTALIRANRLFEQDLKAMKTYGELMQREANDIGKL